MIDQMDSEIGGVTSGFQSIQEFLLSFGVAFADEIIDLYSRASPDTIVSKIATAIDKALKSGGDKEIGHDYMADIDERYTESVRFTKETPWDIVNELTSGGLGKGELGVFVAPAGIGKSHGVTTQMEKATLFDQVAGKKARFEVVKGAMSGIGLFAKLYKFSDAKNVLVFDDCDIWEDQDAVNVLKGALDSGKTRRISWNKDSRILREEGIPNSFNFNGSVIFITNKSFDAKKAGKMQPHLDALQSRCHFLDLTVDSERDKMLRIKQVHRDADGGLFAEYDFTQEQTDEIMNFIWDNHNKLREVSLRMCLKVADLVKISANWRELAKATCMKG